jgi:hypothetical protein
MVDYPTIMSQSIYFTPTILGSIAPKIPDQKYYIESVSLEILYDDFQVLPNDYDVGASWV